MNANALAGTLMAKLVEALARALWLQRAVALDVAADREPALPLMQREGDMTIASDSVRAVKANEFLWIAQAGLLALAADAQRADPERDPWRVATYSGSGIFIRMDEAIRAAGLIPGDMEATTAAREFCSFWHAFDNNEDRSPGWFTRYGREEPDYSAISKVEQFLWLVQTVILAEAANQAVQRPDQPENSNGSSVIAAMTEAVRAAKLIPLGLNATEAANEFSAYTVPGMRERHSPPHWYA